MVGFKPPSVEDNEEGWGPTSVPPQFESVPFMPFSKGERLGRIADFTGGTGRQHYQSRFREPAPGTSVFNFDKVEEGDAFEIVDNKPIKKPSGGPQRRPQQQQQQQGRGWGAGGGRGGGGGRGFGDNRGGGRFGQQRQPWRDQQRAQYTASIDIRPDWQVLGDNIALPALHKLSTVAGECEELVSVGSIPSYDRAADRVTPKMPAKLQRAAGPRRAPTASQDPILRRLAAEGAGNVFISDYLLSVLMTAPRSVLPWDIVVEKKGDQLFFDHRPGSTLDFLTNGETAPDPPTEDADAINGVQQLRTEATAVNQAFREQVLTSNASHSLGTEALPQDLAGSGAPPPGFRYRRWTLGNIRLVVRCEVDGFVKAGGEGVQLVAVHALNEFDPRWSGVDWRQKLENQRGAVLATELKNNAAKMARWTATALVGGIDVIKLGYVSRTLMKSRAAHMLLGTQAVKPRDFAAQMNLSMENAWGIVRALMDLCMDEMQEDGKYMLVRDANKPQMRLYAIPSGLLDVVAEEEGDEEGEIEDMEA